MEKQKKDGFDTIDDYFSNINADEIAKKITQGVDKLSQNISSTIEDSMKNSGYNNFSEFFEGEIRDKKGQKPHFSNLLKDFDSRIDYVKDALNNVDYEIKFRGYFKDGHEQALEDIHTLIDKYENDLDMLFKRIKQQIQEVKNHSSSYKKGYIDGYISGCEYVQKAIKTSKNMMMKRIINELDK